MWKRPSGFPGYYHQCPKLFFQINLCFCLLRLVLWSKSKILFIFRIPKKLVSVYLIPALIQLYWIMKNWLDFHECLKDSPQYRWFLFSGAYFILILATEFFKAISAKMWTDSELRSAYVYIYIYIYIYIWRRSYIEEYIYIYIEYKKKYIDEEVM